MFNITQRHKSAAVQICIAILLITSSCTSTKKFRYFNDLPKDSAILHLDTLQSTAYTIQRDDIIELKISGRNDQTAADFNLKSGGYTNGQGVVPQYLVDVNGEINFFFIR